MLERILLAEPRGFCAGVRRAVSLVEETLAQYGAPVYVRHEIVHNKHVISALQAKGAIFIEEIEQAEIGRPLIFSAHGVASDVMEKAVAAGFKIIDATCPLVDKVHLQIKKYAAAGLKIVVIGKPEHPEIIGTVGQLPPHYPLCVIRSAAEVETLPFAAADEVGFVTQTTLSVEETKEIVLALRRRFPKLSGLKKDDICYATTNRQAAVKALAAEADMVVIIGSKNSSNSRQLQQVALQNGAENAVLIDDVSEFDWSEAERFRTLGISAGASAPEHLVTELLNEIKRRYNKIKIQRVIITAEHVEFKR